MVTVEVIGLDKLAKRLADTQARIVQFKTVDVGHELSTWQTDEMHRKHASTRQGRSRASTTIRPHSRYEMMRSKNARVSARRHHKPPPMHTSNRPILRPQLLDELHDRMDRALTEKIHW